MRAGYHALASVVPAKQDCKIGVFHLAVLLLLLHVNETIPLKYIARADCLMENPVLFENTENPKPDNAVVQTIETIDKIVLRVAFWQPTHNLTRDGNALGTICLFHGFSEYIEKYYEVIAELRRRGFAVATMDWRGHGMSKRYFKNRARGHVPSFRHYQRDLQAFIEKFVQPNCPKPYYALAHSMGGHNIFRACANGHGRVFERVVLCAPMLHLAPPNLIGRHWLTGGRETFSNKIISQRPTRILSGLLRLLGLGWVFASGGNDLNAPFDKNKLTSDPVRFERTEKLLRHYPELGIGGPTYAWISAACRSMRKVLKPAFLQKIDVPILIIAAGTDQVVSTAALEKIGPELRIGHQVVILGAKHEILQERDELREQFWAAFDAYIPGSDLVRSTYKTPHHNQA